MADPLIMVGIMALFGLGVGAHRLLGGSLAAGRLRRRMRKVPRRPLREVQDGDLTRVVGRTRARSGVVAPVSGRPCAFWRVEVRIGRQEQRGRQTVTVWDAVVDQIGEEDGFFLDTDAGAVEVRGRDMELAIEDARRWDHIPHERMSDAFRALLADNMTVTAGDGNTRILEQIVADGAELAVVGEARWVDDPDGAPEPSGYREAIAPRRLVLSPSAETALLVSDHPSART